jgi:hypothetical protein
VRWSVVRAVVQALAGTKQWTGPSVRSRRRNEADEVPNCPR